MPHTLDDAGNAISHSAEETANAISDSAEATANAINDFFTSQQSVTMSHPKMGVSVVISGGFEHFLSKFKATVPLGKLVGFTGMLDLYDPYNQGGGFNREMFEIHAQAGWEFMTAPITPETIENTKQQIRTEFGEAPNQILDSYDDEEEIKRIIRMLKGISIITIKPPKGCAPDLETVGYLRGIPDPQECGTDYVNDYNAIKDEDLAKVIAEMPQQRTTTNAETVANQFLQSLGFIDTLIYRVYEAEQEKLMLPLLIIAGVTILLMLIVLGIKWRRRGAGVQESQSFS